MKKCILIALLFLAGCMGDQENVLTSQANDELSQRGDPSGRTMYCDARWRFAAQGGCPSYDYGQQSFGSGETINLNVQRCGYQVNTPYLTVKIMVRNTSPVTVYTSYGYAIQPGTALELWSGAYPNCNYTAGVNLAIQLFNYSTLYDAYVNIDIEAVWLAPVPPFTPYGIVSQDGTQRKGATIRHS